LVVQVNVSTIVSSEFVRTDAETTVSKLTGYFDDPELKGVVVTNDGDYAGVVTRRQLLTSHRQPTAKAGSFVWHVPTISPREDVREVARLMVGSDSMVLPVVEGNTLVGVVTADDLLGEVLPHLDALEVRHVYTAEMVTLAPTDTVGEALHAFREHHVTHLPVVEDDTPVGMVSLTDVVSFTTRTVKQPQGGSASPTIQPKGSHGGFGARQGVRDRLLNLPIRDLMNEPVDTIGRQETLDAAVESMFDLGISSLVVVDDADAPIGIVTKTDVLLALTWTAEGNRGVQLVGAEYLDDIDYEEITAIVDALDGKYGEMTVLEAKIHLHPHDEKLRGTPLMLARIRFYTDRGHFIATGEGYGAAHAIHQARDVLDRQLRDVKTDGHSKKHPDPEFWDTIYGWQLSR
jgi:CBS domain-containing protein